MSRVSSKKEPTPPPLLLMPAGGGLTLTPPEHPNILMPIVQSVPTPTILDPEEEAEADSFVGQSTAPVAPRNATSLPVTSIPRSLTPIQPDYFQSPPRSGHDPFASLGSEPAPTPAVQWTPTLAPSSQPPPATKTTAAGVSLQPALTPTLPPAEINSPAATNIYRHQGGRPQYAAPPTGQLPPSTSFSPSNFQPPTAKVSPMTALPPYQPQSYPQPAAREDSTQYTGGLYYQPIRFHWCYQQNQGEVEVWRPFSVLDSMNLEVAFNTALRESSSINTVLPTNGGRFDVILGERLRYPVYWPGVPVAVRRCSWFYRREGDNRYIPYQEDFAAMLENEYKKTMETGMWHRRLEFPGNVIIVMHSANVIVQFPASAAPDEWGNVQGDQMRPRVVKRGVEDFATIESGERDNVDHLVFVVPGIEDLFNNKEKSVEILTDDLRSNALSLLGSHFSQAVQSQSIGRVEFLPIIWTQALQEGTLVLKEQIGSITLPSTSKLRHFINNTLVDTMLYTSPLYCQKICETVGSEMNRMFHIFLERNINFSGDVSIAGHSLGSVIVFDLLLHQRQPGQAADTRPDDQRPSEQVLIPPASLQGPVEVDGDSYHEEEVLSLETLLAKVGLQDKVGVFQEEQMDLESLIMCSENDLKDIGIAMGPRKKLLGLLKEEQDKKAKEREKAEHKKLEEKKAVLEVQATETVTTKIYPGEDIVTAEYIQGQFGAGRLKITYPQLDFIPSAMFALGSPIPVFLSIQGVHTLSEMFQLPTCSRVYNLFHPFDPMAYRLEPLIRPNAAPLKPVQIPHYKGRKRLHLEFKEAVSRYGSDIKQKIVDSLKSTWNTINQFARAHKTEENGSVEQEVQSQVDQMMSHMAQQQADDDVASLSSMAEEDIHMGQLNEGQRVDYVLQEGPLESFNDYLFALASHSCYWESEDTALFLLKEIYSPLGFRPVMPGRDGNKLESQRSLPPPPPMGTGSGNSPYMLPSFPGSGPRQTPSPALYQPPVANPPPALFQSPVASSQSLPPLYQSPATSPHSFVGVASQSQTPLAPASLVSSYSQVQAQGQPPGFRKSPYVAPDFSNLPALQNQGSSGPPPMGPALAGGYRRGQP